MKSKHTVEQTARAYLLTALVAVLLAVNYQLFIVVNHFAPAGLNGIATMIQYKTGFSIGYMSLLINIPLCLLSYFFINRRFALRSLCFCLVYSFSYLLLQQFDLTAFQYCANGHDTVFPVILSGIISGLVYATCFRSSASTGGTDIISRYISTRKPELNFFYITFTLNAIVAAVSFFVYAVPDENGVMLYDYEPVCLCIMYCFISSFMGNRMILTDRRAVKFTIITKYPREITAAIAAQLHHSSTQIAACGSYAGESLTLLLCVINPHQIPEFKALLQEYDSTFSFLETVNETCGNFKRIK